MYQIDNSSAASTLPTPTAVGVPGFFTDGNPSTGVDPTILPAEFLNMVMMEIANVVTGVGFTLSKTNFTQLKQAIGRSQQKTAVLSDTGAANAYAAANTPALVVGDLASGLMQKVSIVNANTGAATYAPDGLTAKPILGMALTPLQGGELPAKGIAVLLYLIAPAVNAGNGAWILIECTGGAVQVAAATQSQHAVNLGQFINSLLANGYARLPSSPGQPGLIIQWGITPTVASGGVYGGTFPIPFPTAALQIVANAASSGVITSSFTGAGEISSRSTFNIYCFTSGGGTGVYRWIAVGY